LMYRGHSTTLDAHNSKTANGAIDVTDYPDITELYLAADVLITDYSSVMFDFAVTGKPMIFLTPDIEMYVSDRGFYFDFVAEAPGPICHTTAEVI
jgi:CDP-glycerol glycerophosphotransferase